VFALRRVLALVQPAAFTEPITKLFENIYFLRAFADFFVDFAVLLLAEVDLLLADLAILPKARSQPSRYLAFVPTRVMVTASTPFEPTTVCH
jgi:hypothetical protein